MRQQPHVTRSDYVAANIALAQAELAASDYHMWRRFRTTTENDAARLRMNEALLILHLICATTGGLVH